jgi:hypothetical protein
VPGSAPRPAAVTAAAGCAAKTKRYFAGKRRRNHPHHHHSASRSSVMSIIPCLRQPPPARRPDRDRRPTRDEQKTRGPLVTVRGTPGRRRARSIFVWWGSFPWSHCWVSTSRPWQPAAAGPGNLEGGLALPRHERPLLLSRRTDSLTGSVCATSDDQIYCTYKWRHHHLFGAR